jgi:23S rRNA pseudouridine1911/1915/1917 synthase
MTDEVLRLVYEDPWMVILDKPAGIPAVPDKSKDLSLRTQAEKILDIPLFPVNRIDRPVKGLCIFAKYAEAAGELSKMIVDGKIIKTYLALVEGVLPPQENILKDRLSANPKSNKTAVLTPEDTKGKWSETKITVLDNSDNYTLVKVRPLTGRQHQIRAQLSHHGMTIKGDVKYGSRRKNKDRSIDLLSYSLTFDHPYIKEKIHVTAEIPGDALWQFFSVSIQNNPSYVRPK